LAGAPDKPLILLATINAKWIHPSLALRLLKANLGRLEDRCVILEFALRQPLKEKIGPLLAAKPRILGLSVSIWNHAATLELLEALEEAWRAGAAAKPFIILGGPEVSFLPEGAEIFRHADTVIRGEGELVFRETCESLLAGGRPGKFMAAPPVDLAAIDPAYRLYTGEDIQNKLIYVEASRGCPFGCEFCLSAVKRPSEPAVRYFPLEPFLANMEILIRRGVRTFKFLDRTFNLDIDRARRILEFFLARLSPGQCVHFEMVPSRFPPELVEVLARFPPGALRLEIGFQTFNPETAALISRPGHPAEELAALEKIRRETAALVHADLIAGLPGEDLASFGRGFDLLWQALSTPAARPGPPAAAEIQLGILKCLPGAPISRHNAAYGMVYAPAPPYEVRETAALPVIDLGRIKNFARFWELVVNRGVFPDLGPALFPAGEPVFRPFLELSDRLFSRFGRNWGIDRNRLRQALEEKAR
jgi:radical SAM superfamily enzyme YgiQ (UPF0313 family)